MGYVMAALPGVISGLTLAVVSLLAAAMKRQFGGIRSQLNDFRAEHSTLLESQRNQLKASIVACYERAVERGYITAMELDTVNRMADSYFALGGNHYIHALVKRMNEDMEIRGELPGECV